MDKKSAINIIENTFNASFDESRFMLFAKNLLNDIEPKNNSYSGQYIWDDFKKHINTYKRIGKYIDPEGDALDVLIVEVKTVRKLEQARTALRNFVIKHLNKFEKDYALVAFYSKEDKGADWRFSFIKLEHQAYLDEEKQKVKTRKEFTPAKRYSFLVGEYEHAHTAKKQLLPLLQNVNNNPTIKELEDAFSIEKVTDEFFTQYKDLYVKLYEHFEKDNRVKAELEKAGIDNSRFTKKLLGQIVFLYFLQKKGWLGVPKNEHWGKGDKRFIQNLYEKAQAEDKNYFKDYLQPLFYEALAKERNNDNSYYKRFDCRIPFLNGGLFEAEYDWQNANITIPEDLFRNSEKNKAGDIGTGVLDVFDRYNFTIKEDEPLDKEVAVDPEMLGKVFENMLEITERKSKGAFYTPREIVHYMCQESLIHYLDNALEGKVKKADIETFIRKGHFALENDQRVADKGKETKDYKYQIPESIRQNADLIDQKLSEIKILDPAIGSGAFPVGLLHELVTAHLVIKPHLSHSYFSQKLDGFGFQFHESVNESRYVYRLKRHIIQESIYGVDIDASAIDIARLRLWLSLVVDEDDLDPIETLPNLDYKIVKGNSLIGLPDGAMRSLDIEKELENLKKQFYDETNEAKKKELRTQINTKIRELLDSAEQFAGYKIDFDFKLYFSEVWHQKGGFDVVIGNPPYLRIQGIRKENPAFADMLVKQYQSATGSFDLYVCFAEKGLSVTHSRGILNFIMPVKWTNSAFGKGLRNLVKQHKATKKIISFGAYQVFNASTYTGIQSFQRNNKELLYIELDRDLPDNTAIQNYLNNLNEEYFNNYQIQNLPTDTWVLTSKQVATILNKLNQQPLRVSDVFEKIFQGIATSKDSVYFIMDAEKNEKTIIGYSKELDREVEIELGLVKPLLKGNQVHRYEKLHTNNYVIFPYNLVDGKAILMTEKEIQDRFPKGYKYLKENEKVLRGRENGKFNIDGGWFQFGRGQGISFGGLPKLINPDISLCGNYSYDINGEFYDTTTLYGYIKYDKIIHPYGFYLALLNSTICWYYLKNTGTVLANGYFRFMPRYVEKIPLPNPDTAISGVIEILSIYAIESKKINEVIYNFYETLIDTIVYELYFPEELKSAGKEILKYLGDLKPITDNMSDEEKLAIIQSEFERLYDPNHPVRFALETLDSIEEVRIIKEALK